MDTAAGNENGGAATRTTSTGHLPGVSDQQRSQAGGAMHAAPQTASNVGGEDRPAAASVGTSAQDLARRAREQTSAAADTLYQQGARASEYMTRNIHQYPAIALLIAAAVGYGAAYLIHGAGWRESGGRDQHLD